MSVVLNNKAMEMEQGRGEEINLYFSYFLSIRKTIQASFQLSAALGLQATFSVRSGDHLPTDQQVLVEHYSSTLSRR